MATDRRQRWVLAALGVVLLIVGYRAWPHTAATPSPSSNEGRAAATAGATAPMPTAPDVHLGTLQAARPAPAPATRDPFRFKPTAPPPAASRPERGAPAATSGPPPPPSLPPIPLQFIGILGRPQEKIAVLRDPAGHVDYGVEGAIIEGRYRVLRIGEESIELAYLDGRGRQTLRLTGS
jgi:hypothetical protein